MSRCRDVTMSRGDGMLKSSTGVHGSFTQPDRVTKTLRVLAISERFKSLHGIRQCLVLRLDDAIMDGYGVRHGPPSPNKRSQAWPPSALAMLTGAILLELCDVISLSSGWRFTKAVSATTGSSGTAELAPCWPLGEGRSEESPQICTELAG